MPVAEFISAANSVPTTVPRADLVQSAKRIMSVRRARLRLFGGTISREVAWEMLLILYIRDGGARTTVTRLANAARTPGTTALRWIDYLESQRLITRVANPLDARSVFIELTEKARSLLDLFLIETRDLPT